MRTPAPPNSFLILSLMMAACATGARAQAPAPDPAAPLDSLAPVQPPAQVSPGEGPAIQPPPAGTNAAGSEADLQMAIAKHLAGDRANAQRIAEALRTSGSPEMRERASALLALVLLEGGEPAEAQRVLGSALSPASKFLAGVAAARLGQAAIAWDHLSPFVASQTPPIVAGLSAQQASQMLAVASAESAAGTGHTAEALDAWQRYADGAAAFERIYALRRAEAAVAQLSESDALALYQRSRGNLARVVLASKAALALAASGRANEAKQATDEASKLRVGFDSTSAAAGSVWVGTGDPGRIGLSIPMSGKAQPLGMALTRGAVVAIGAPSTMKDVAPLQVMVRDTTSPAGALRAATELSREEAVLAVVGLSDAPTVDQLSRDGVPYLMLGGANPGAQTTAFALVHDGESRVRALAQVAAARGVRTFAVMAPDSDSARRSTETFRQAVASVGGQIVAEVKYAPSATAFTKEVETLKKQRWDALFVPDTADKLELIGPALAVADLWPQPASSVVASAREKPRRGSAAAKRRHILLLCTAPGLSKRTLSRAGRYIQGALLTPGYYPDPEQASAARFVAEFKRLYGHDPGASDAYGFDGVHLLRSCVERGARTRADVLRMLGAGVEFQGVTGVIHFGADHGRQDRALVYEANQDRFVAQP